MARGNVNVRISADADPLHRETRRAETSLERLNRAGSKSMKGLGTAAKVGGAALVGGLAVGISKAVSEYEDAAKVAGQTNAVIKSTGGVANVTAKDVDRLSTSLSNKAAIDDEVIARGANMLLTFTNIRNEAGKGNRIFDQATRILTDMSVATGQDMTKSAVQLGKALNDPIKGVTALQRVGVTFTDDQKQQIATLVESGNTMKAQKVILRELNKEFGGSAEAQARPLERAKVAVDNMFEALGSKLAPVVETVSNGIADFVTGLQTGEGAGGDFADTVKSAFATVKAAVGDAINTVGGFLHRNREDIAQLGQAFVNIGKGIAAVFEHVILPVVKRAWPGIVQIVRGGLRMIGGLIKIFSGIFTGDFGKAWAGIKQIVSGAVKAIGGEIRTITAPIRETLSKVGPLFTTAFRTAQRVVGNTVAAMLRAFGGFIRNTAGRLPLVGDKFDGIADKIDRAAGKVDRLGEEIKDVPRRKTVDIDIQAALKNWGRLQPPGEVLGGDGWGVEDALTTVIQRQAQQKVNQNPGALFGGKAAGGVNLMGANPNLGPFALLASTYGLSVTSGLRPGAITSSGNQSYHATGRAIDIDAGSAGAMLSYARMMAGLFGSRLKELIHTPLGFSIKNGRRVAPYAQADHFDHVHVAMQHGGLLPGGRTGDRNLIAAEDGEFVVNRKAAAAFGPLLEAINRGVPRFQKGGWARTPANVAADAAIKAGFGGQHLVNMLAIAGRESGYNPRAHNDDASTGDNSYGLWQINVLPNANPQYAGLAKSGRLFDPYTNARVAKKMFDASGYGPWVGVGYGNAPDFIDDAQAAIAAVQGRDPAGASGKSKKKKEKPTKGPTGTLESRLAQIDIAAGKAEHTPTLDDDKRVFLARARLLNARVRRIRARLRKINRALKGKLTPSTRRRLLDEKGSLLTELGQRLTDLRENPFPLTSPSDTGGSDTGDTGGGGQDNSALEANTAALNQVAELIKADQQQRARLEYLLNTQSPQILDQMRALLSTGMGRTIALNRQAAGQPGRAVSL